jgi:hypothetical protein
MSLAFLGVVLIWCTFPILNLSDVLTATVNDLNIVSIAQINIWLSLAASVLGCYTASAFIYRKFHVHDMVFSAITVIIIFYLGWNRFQFIY